MVLVVSVFYLIVNIVGSYGLGRPIYSILDWNTWQGWVLAAAMPFATLFQFWILKLVTDCKLKRGKHPEIVMAQKD